MSHVLTINTEVRDTAAIVAACRRLGLPKPSHGTAELFIAQATGVLVNLPEWHYPVVIDTATGQIRYDNYNGAWGKEAELHRFLQAYVVERSRIEARKKNLLTTEQALADGSILVEIEVGGQA